jgi:hypothetical protein
MLAELEPVGELNLKGFHRPINVFNVRSCSRSAGAGSDFPEHRKVDEVTPMMYPPAPGSR